MMEKHARIFVAGHRGLAGSAICRRLEDLGYTGLIRKSRAELDLRDAVAVDRFFAAERPEYVFLAAAKVGGILANSRSPVDFLVENLAIELNVFQSAHRHGVEKLLFLGSSCVYPKMAVQPIEETSLLSGPLEPTNEWYAVAKIAGLKMGQAYRQQYGFRAISLMPTNLYGPGDNFNLETSHVLPALIRKFHEATRTGAKEVVIWGSGTPRREFLHVDDFADAAVFLMKEYDQAEIVNVGVGEDISIREVAEMLAVISGFAGELKFDVSKPDGTPRKLLNVDRLSGLGWRAKISLRPGLEETYAWFQQQVEKADYLPA